jgi:hypothetical protein
MSESVAVLKPGSSATILYLPVGSDGAVYSPAWSVTMRARQAGALIGERHGGAGDGRARRVGDGSQDGAGHCLGGEADRQQTQRNNETQYDSLHFLPPCAARAARYASVAPMSSTAPRSIEIARAVATTAAATSLPTRSRGSRSIGAAMLTAATTSP